MQSSPLKTSTCFWMCFISIIPIVGLGYVIACSANTDEGKRNLARALLLLKISLLLLGVTSFAVLILSLDVLI
ncbi:MAG: hypothetical protein IKK58_04595 [Clostridia bacterium]|nr:hypothetical protein [Clostridia bacterium]